MAHSRGVLGILIIMLLVIGAIIVVPIALLWALQTLGVPVSITFWTWLATFTILTVFGGTGVKVRKDA